MSSLQVPCPKCGNLTELDKVKAIGSCGCVSPSVQDLCSKNTTGYIAINGPLAGQMVVIPPDKDSIEVKLNAQDRMATGLEKVVYNLETYTVGTKKYTVLAPAGMKLEEIFESMFTAYLSFHLFRRQVMQQQQAQQAQQAIKKFN